MEREKVQIEAVRIRGFMSIRETEVTLGPLNVVVGSNGSGTSNLVAFFAFLRESLNDRLDEYVARRGGPNAFLYLGSKTTQEINGEMLCETEHGWGTLHQRLKLQPPDRLAFSGNSHTITTATPSAAVATAIGNAYREEGIGVYHFHDTTLTSAIRTAGYIENNRQLHGDGGNLAAVLYRLRQTKSSAYKRIVSTIRLFAPFFDDFSLAPRALDPTGILLNWKQIGSDYEFGPHQLSDGTIRAMALTTLLLQPGDELPRLIVIDEPEIGLHPYAVNLIMSLILKVSYHTQIIVATQSSQMLDSCEPEQIICVDRDEQQQESVFHRPNLEHLRVWLEDYSLGQVWEHNIIGGGPH